MITDGPAYAMRPSPIKLEVQIPVQHEAPAIGENYYQIHDYEH